MDFDFSAGPFGGTEAGEWSADDRGYIAELRNNHPELSAWGDLAIGEAWGSYSQDILAVNWCDWIEGRDEAFLAYLYVRIANPEFNFGGTGLYMEDVEDLGQTRPWLTNAPLPAWASKKTSS